MPNTLPSPCGTRTGIVVPTTIFAGELFMVVTCGSWSNLVLPSLANNESIADTIGLLSVAKFIV